jgi:hypothetical protein
MTLKRKEPICVAALVIAAFVLFCSISQATRPSRSETMRRRSLETTVTLGRFLQRLQPAQLKQITGSEKGCKMFGANMLTAIMQLDPESSTNALYDQILELEKEKPACRLYLLFDLSKEPLFYVLDTKHGFLFPHDARYDESSPRTILKRLCSSLGLQEAYEINSGDFADDESFAASRPIKLQKKAPGIIILCKYWLLILALGIGDFYLVDFKYLRKERLVVKLYAMGLHLVCILITLTIVPLELTGNPFPGWRELARFDRTGIPGQLYTLIDTAMLASFIWWPVSVVALFKARQAGVSFLIPLMYVIAAPLGLFFSESPFPGMHKYAFPFCGFAIVLVNALYVRSRDPGPQEENGSTLPDS